MSEQHIDTIKRIYEAFGRGDVETIVANVSEQTEWSFNVWRSDVPWHAPIKGKQALPQFFANLQQVEIRQFEPRGFFTDQDHVAALIRLDYTVKKTGRRVTEDQIQLWRFDQAGKVAELRHFEDTAQVLAAFNG